MSENDWKKRLGMVYSTDPDYHYDEGEKEESDTPLPSEQLLYIQLDRKGRKGKTVTLITGFKGKDSDLQELARELKKKCGSGGSAGDGEILIQGNLKEKVQGILNEMGYKVKLK